LTIFVRRQATLSLLWIWTRGVETRVSIYVSREYPMFPPAGRRPVTNRLAAVVNSLKHWHFNLTTHIAKNVRMKWRFCFLNFFGRHSVLALIGLLEQCRHAWIADLKSSSRFSASILASKKILRHSDTIMLIIYCVLADAAGRGRGRKHASLGRGRCLAASSMAARPLATHHPLFPHVAHLPASTD
jgi:hypothetical protein